MFLQELAGYMNGYLSHLPRKGWHYARLATSLNGNYKAASTVEAGMLLICDALIPELVSGSVRLSRLVDSRWLCAAHKTVTLIAFGH